MLQVLEGHEQGGAAELKSCGCAAVPRGWEPGLAPFLPGLSLPELSRKIVKVGLNLRNMGMAAQDSLRVSSVAIVIPAWAAQLARQRAGKDSPNGLGDLGFGCETILPSWFCDVYHYGQSAIETGIQYVRAPVDFLIHHAVNFLWAAVAKILGVVIGQEKGERTVRVLRQAIEAGAQSLILPLELVCAIIPILLDIVVPPGGQSRKDALVRLWFRINVAISQVLLDSPLLVIALGSVREIRGGSVEQTRAFLKKAAQKDPTFGVAAIMFVIGLIYGGGWSKALANFPQFAADVLGLHRKVVREIARDEIGLSDAQLEIWDLVYGITIMALNNYVRFADALQNLGMDWATADNLWQRIVRAIQDFNPEAVVASFVEVIRQLSRLGTARELRQKATEKLTPDPGGRLQSAEAKLIQAEQRRDQAERGWATAEQQQRATQRMADATDAERKQLADRLRVAERSDSEWQKIATQRRNYAIVGFGAAGLLALYLVTAGGR